MINADTAIEGVDAAGDVQVADFTAFVTVSLLLITVDAHIEINGQVIPTVPASPSVITADVPIEVADVASSTAVKPVSLPVITDGADVTASVTSKPNSTSTSPTNVVDEPQVNISGYSRQK